MSVSEPKRPVACTTLLDLDSYTLSLIAEKGRHRELRSTCKRLQGICDDCRTCLHIKNLSRAGKSPMPTSKWPRLTRFSLSESSRSEDESLSTLVWPNVLLTATFGRPLLSLSISLRGTGQVNGSLLGEVLKQCQATLDSLWLEEFTLTGALETFVVELQNCKLKSLSVHSVLSPDGMEGRNIWSSELVSGSLGPSLQTLEVSIEDNEDTSVADWHRAGQQLKNLRVLHLWSWFSEELLAGFLAGCPQLRELQVDYLEQMDEHPGDHVLFAAHQCPHLEKLKTGSCISSVALQALPGRCQALRHLEVYVDVHGLRSMDEARETLCALTSLEHLELAFMEEVDMSRELLEAVTSGLLALRQLKILHLYHSPKCALIMHVHSFIWALPALKVLHCHRPIDHLGEVSIMMSEILSSPFAVRVEYRCGYLTIKRR